ncbi:MAG: nucleotidyltransferase family protein [Chitinophagaceae bacterium]
MINSYSIIILAAGSSDRLGKPKQLLPYKNKTLLQYLIDEAKATSALSVLLVLGANAAAIQSELQTENIRIVINDDWQEGMASSIRCGINELQKINPATDAAILMVCDQPYVSASLLNDLILAHNKTNKPIVTSSYDNTTGPPALFHKSIFQELLQLTGDTGARSIVQKHINDVATVSFPKGSIDIDTAADYEAL